jgi:hypothetical protein
LPAELHDSSRRLWRPAEVGQRAQFLAAGRGGTRYRFGPVAQQSGVIALAGCTVNKEAPPRRPTYSPRRQVRRSTPVTRSVRSARQPRARACQVSVFTLRGTRQPLPCSKQACRCAPSQSCLGIRPSRSPAKFTDTSPLKVHARPSSGSRLRWDGENMCRCYMRCCIWLSRQERGGPGFLRNRP